MGAPFKNALDTVAEGEWDQLVAQGVMKFADATARNAALTAPTFGMLALNQSTVRGELYDGAGWLNSPAGAKSSQAAATNYLTATLSAVPQADGIAGSGAFEHRSGLFFNAGANQRLTIPASSGGRSAYDGIWVVACGLIWTANATGYRELNLRLNGTTYLARTNTAAISGSSIGQNVPWVGFLQGGDYVEAVAYQTSGGNLTAASSWLACARLGLI